MRLIEGEVEERSPICRRQGSSGPRSRCAEASKVVNQPTTATTAKTRQPKPGSARAALRAAGPERQDRRAWSRGLFRAATAAFLPSLDGLLVALQRHLLALALCLSFVNHFQALHSAAQESLIGSPERHPKEGARDEREGHQPPSVLADERARRRRCRRGEWWWSNLALSFDARGQRHSKRSTSIRRRPCSR